MWRKLSLAPFLLLRVRGRGFGDVVGKGTQADLLHQPTGACHLSTGDAFRAAGSRPDCEQSPAMKEALGYMRRGSPMSDSTVWEMVRERFATVVDVPGADH